MGVDPCVVNRRPWPAEVIPAARPATRAAFPLLMIRPRSDRRRFLRSSTAAAAGVLAFPHVRISRGDGVSPNERINLACVGVGGKGTSDTAKAAEGNNVVALCDVDDHSAASSFKAFPDARRFRDYRAMLDRLGNEIDAVTVSTADHMHFAVAMAAMDLGKHVFVQKPLCNTLWETREMLKMARRRKVQTQMGIQGHTNEGLRLLKEWLDAGAIGAVREIHIWTNRPIWPQGPDVRTPEAPVPAHLDWDVWQGIAAPERPYSPAYLPFNWRGFWDYGSGALGDIGCHAFDAPFHALDLSGDFTVEAESTAFTDLVAPKASTVTYRFPAKGARSEVVLVWYDGGRIPERPDALDADRELRAEGGQLYFGDGGTIYNPGWTMGGPRLVPESAMKAFVRPEKTLERSRFPGNPQQEWCAAIRGDGTPGANFEYAVPLTEMVLAGNLAIRSRQRVRWSSEKGETDSDEANRFLKRTYRAGWEPNYG